MFEDRDPYAIQVSSMPGKPEIETPGDGGDEEDEEEEE
jgi:hypothetical protein